MAQNGVDHVTDTAPSGSPSDPTFAAVRSIAITTITAP